MAETGDQSRCLLWDGKKRAFTLLVSVAADEHFASLSGGYQGSHRSSLPKKNAPALTRCDMLDEVRVVSHKTIGQIKRQCKSCQQNSPAPYFDATKARLGPSTRPEVLWLIDVWSVHDQMSFEVDA